MTLADGCTIKIEIDEPLTVPYLGYVSNQIQSLMKTCILGQQTGSFSTSAEAQDQEFFFAETQ